MDNILDQERFEYWLMDMESALDNFIDSFPNKDELDFSLESLGVLEGALLDRYQSIEDMKSKSEMVFIDGAARYVGGDFS